MQRKKEPKEVGDEPAVIDEKATVAAAAAAAIETITNAAAAETTDAVATAAAAPSDPAEEPLATHGNVMCATSSGAKYTPIPEGPL